LNAEGKKVGSDWQTKNGKTERTMAIGGLTVSQELKPDGSVVTRVNTADGGNDKRPFSEATYNPNGEPKLVAKGAKGPLKAEEPLFRSPDGKQAIYADGRRELTVTDDPKRVSVTEFPPTDSRKTETTFRPEANGGIAAETVMRDGTVERAGTDAKGGFKSRSWNDPEKGELTQKFYGDGSVVTTDGAGRQLGTADKPVSLGTSKDGAGRDVSLMSDGSTVTDLGDGKRQTTFPDNRKDGKQAEVRDDKTGSTTTVFKDRVETLLDKTSGTNKTIEYTDGPKKGKTESFGKDERGEYESRPLKDTQGNSIEQKFYANGTVATDFSAAVKGELSEQYKSIIREPGKEPVGVRRDGTTEKLSAEDQQKALATITGADGNNRSLKADGTVSRTTAVGVETVFPNGRTELAYSSPKSAN
jgi:hypothetical protein